MRDIGSHENNRLLKDANGPNGRYQYVVDAAQFDVDLETQIGQRLRRRPCHILGLNALSRDSNQSVTHSLYFGLNI